MPVSHPELAGFDFTLGDARLTALPSGALWWPAARLLVVSDLHLGKSERMARRGGPLLPPFDAAVTLTRLGEDIARTDPATVVSLGDGFDDANAALAPADAARLSALQSGRRWIWVAGNHDPGSAPFAGESVDDLRVGNLTLRHIAEPSFAGAELSGHYHPKHRLRGARARACFLLGGARLILPAYGAYTGGLSTQSPVLTAIFPKPPLAILTGARALPVPLSAG